MFFLKLMGLMASATQINAVQTSEDETSTTLVSKILYTKYRQHVCTQRYVPVSHVVDSVPQCPQSNCIQPLAVSAIVTFSASSLGIGAYYNNLTIKSLTFQGENLRINILKCRAVYYAPKYFLPHLRGRVVQVTPENITAEFYINKWEWGGWRETCYSHLCEEAVSLWE